VKISKERSVYGTGTFLGEIFLADVTSDNLEAGVKALMFNQLSNLPCPRQM
jgi:hypothetical protein